MRKASGKYFLVAILSLACMANFAALFAEQQEIDEVVPKKVKPGQQTRVLVFGRGFSVSNTSVTVCGITAESEVLSSQAIAVYTPFLLAGEAQLVVNGPNGVTDSPIDVIKPDRFTVYCHLNTTFDAVFCWALGATHRVRWCTDLPD